MSAHMLGVPKPNVSGRPSYQESLTSVIPIDSSTMFPPRVPVNMSSLRLQSVSSLALLVTSTSQTTISK